jgi:glycosyltransferase involved in cell wall biosynthesis
MSMIQSENTKRISSPRVTVLMGVFNGQEFLAEAIDSILSQTFEDYEFLIIDDGSTDNSRKMILSYKDDRIRLIENENNIGLTRSLNKGLSISQGELIARQDADDISDLKRLELQIDFLDKHPEIVLVGTQAQFIDENSNKVYSNWKVPESDLAIKWQSMFNSPFLHSSVMFRRDPIWQDLRGYNEQFAKSQDYELWSRLIYEYKTSNLSELLISFRAHANSVSRTWKKDRWDNLEAIMKQNASKVLQQPVPDNWPRLWINVTNNQLINKNEEQRRVVSFVKDFYSQFIILYPDARKDGEIKRHLIQKYVQIFYFLLKFDGFASVQAFVLALRSGPIEVFKIFLQFLKNKFRVSSLKK